MKVAYVFVSPRSASYKLGQMILPQLEAGTHGVDVAGMFFFDDNVFALRKGDPLGERLATVAIEAERVRQDGGTLSGGEQQMLAIGRCLMGAPDLVMFDEPSLGLAPAMVQLVLATIRDLNRDGLTCVLVEQNVAVSLKLASRAFVLENGRITLTGTGEELLADDRVRQAYLGM